MNNKFKRALSSILAFVMVISVLTVMNVSSVFAASSAYAEWDFTSTNSSSTYGTDITLDESSRIQVNDPTTSGITTSPVIYYSRNTASSNANGTSTYGGSDTYEAYNGSTVTPTKGWKMSGNDSYGWTFVVDPQLSANSAGSYNIKFAFWGNSDNVSTLKVVEVSGNTFGSVSSGTAVGTATASSSSDLQVLEISNLTSNVSFGFSAQPGLAYVGIEYNDINSDTKVVSEEGVYTFFVNDTDRTNNNGAENNTTVFSDASTGTNQLNSGESCTVTIADTDYSLIYRTINATPTVTINVPSGVDSATLYVAANSGGSKARELQLTDSSGSYSKTGDTSSSSSTTAVSTYSGLEAGTTYTLATTGTDKWGYSLLVLVTSTELATVNTTTHTVTTTDGDVYLVAGLTDDAEVVESADSCELYNGDSAVSASGSIDTVYTGVEIDGTVYDASTFGYTYVFGYAIADDSLTDAQVAALANYSLKLVTANAE
ncbi:MAG: hypothetical protein LUC92_04270 [Clostridiales bacterium]|nr:hypothetical protein [Clostridiales bacterium]